MIWLKGAMIVTMDDAMTVIKGGHVVVDGEKITYVGKDEPELSEKVTVINCEKYCIMPGFYNAHTHVPMTLLRSYGEELPLDRWLSERIFPAEAKLNEEIVRWGSELSIAEMLAGGTVSFSDMYFFSEEIIEAVLRTKIKGNVAKALVCFDEVNLNDDGRLKGAQDLYHTYHNRNNGQVKVDIAVHAIYTSNKDYLARVAEEINLLDAVRHIHLSETKKENEDCRVRYQKSPTEVFYESGMFSKPTMAAHCVHLSPSDREILKKCGVTVAHNPTSNLKLGSGIADIGAMMEMGINVALGTDGCASNNNLNMLEEMHLAALLPKGFFQDPTRVSAREALKMATINGAKAQGRADCGSIEVGKRADLIAIDFDKPHLTPNYDVIYNLVYAAQGADVCLTMADGKILYKDGEYMTLDIEKVKAEAKRCAKFLTGE
jgi:5-methylthioadenosine/S-adenosylhomocysteine deaminase